MTISSAQCHPTVPGRVSFYSAWKGKQFCYCLFMFSAPPNGELYAGVFKVTSSGYHSASPSSPCILELAGGVTKTRTSVYEVCRSARSGRGIN